MTFRPFPGFNDNPRRRTTPVVTEQSTEEGARLRMGGWARRWRTRRKEMARSDAAELAELAELELGLAIAWRDREQYCGGTW